MNIFRLRTHSDIIVTSDHHCGVGDAADDLNRSEYMGFLMWMRNINAIHIIDGDGDEGEQNTIRGLAAYNALLYDEEDRRGVIEIIGNHNFDTASLHPCRQRYDAVIVNDKILILHGHQVDPACKERWSIGRPISRLAGWLERTFEPDADEKLEGWWARVNESKYLHPFWERNQLRMKYSLYDLAIYYHCTTVIWGHAHRAGLEFSPHGNIINSGCWTGKNTDFIWCKTDEKIIQQCRYHRTGIEVVNELKLT